MGIKLISEMLQVLEEHESIEELKKYLETNKKDSLVQEWKKNPLDSKIDIENIDDEWDKYKK